MKLKKKDFIEVEFTGRIKGREIFDSNIKKDLEKINSDFEAKPFVFCLGEGMFLRGIDDFLIGKEIGKYEVELKPEHAFGNRNPKLVQMMPMKIFIQHKINPAPGAVFNFDGRIAKILTVSGGRVMVDFNNPIAGKTVVYDIKVLQKIEDINEKIKAFSEFLFKKDLQFEIKETKIVMQVEKPLVKFVEMFRDKFKDIFNLELEIKEIEEEKKKVEVEDKKENK